MLDRVIADTLMLTTQCSAGCGHCPFSNPNLIKLHLPLHALSRWIADARSPLRVISGGEPFEHPEFDQVLEVLQEARAPFRIATGGFVDLKPWATALSQLRAATAHFVGISLGTDVLTGRCARPELSTRWRANLSLLTDLSIPYSLTFTLGSDLDSALLESIRAWGARPELLYFRQVRPRIGSGGKTWLQGANRDFPGLPIILDQFDDRFADPTTDHTV